MRRAWAAAATMVLVVGCGGHRAVSTSGLSAVCTDYNSKLYAVPAPRSADRGAAYASTVLPLLFGSYQRFARVKATKAQAIGYQIFVADLSRGLAVASQLAGTADRRTSKAKQMSAEALVAELAATIAQIRADARPLGLTGCA
jgi:hypothetical protein